MQPFPPTTKPIPPDAVATREPMRWVPHLSIAERDRRWNTARTKMRLANVDALIFLGNDIYWGMGMANLRYMFQVDAQLGADAFFPLAGEPIVWQGVPHTNRPTSMYLSVQDWITDIRTRGGMAPIADEVRERGLERSRIGLVGFSSTLQPTTLLHVQVQALERLLPDVVFEDVGMMFEQMRIVKSDEEIAMLRTAGAIARKVIDAMIDSARPGVPEAVVYAEMIRTHLANGGEPNIFNLFASGPVEHGSHELWHLLHGCEQPLAPSMRPLANGDLIISEWHTKYGGYRCHTEFSVYIGKRAPKELLNIWDVSVQCLEASKEALTAGRTIREAIEIIRRPAIRAGLDWVELGFHAMGVASPEFPSVVYVEGYGHDKLNGDGIGDFVLEEGMTFGNNVGLHDSRWKPDVGCMLSDFMVVRPGKAECLVGTPLTLPQVG